MKVFSDTFWNVSGDGVRMRDGSDGNEIHDNWFEKTGGHGAATMWYCLPPYATCAFLECPSYGNFFYNNLVTGNCFCHPGVAFADLQTGMSGSCSDLGTKITLHDNVVDTCLYHPCPPDTGGID